MADEILFTFKGLAILDDWCEAVRSKVRDTAKALMLDDGEVEEYLVTAAHMRRAIALVAGGRAGERLKDVVCPQCKNPFRLTWSGGFTERVTLVMRGCPSGGIYDVSIECPHCDYEEEL
jgi:hypothetical protein